MTDGPSIPPPPPSAGSSNLVSRAINILTKPASEWRVAEGEASSIGGLVAGYAAILALIAPLALVLGGAIQGAFSAYGFSVGLLIKQILIIYLVALATPVLLGFIIDALTTNLGGQKNSVQAMKLAIYSATAFWVLGIVLILPELWWIWFLGIAYGGYLLWVGVPILLKVPADKAPIFVAASVGIWAVLFIILQQIAWRIIYAVPSIPAVYYG